uniref:Uncharacterized protein n=1 Tax=Biomphalaria glabrata TaxID=6526 RepID=A0A2C9L634_BIOGL
MAQPDFMYANTVDLDDTEAVSNGHHSRQSSYSSGHSLGSNKENGSLGKQASRAGSELSSDASDSQLILRDGGELLGESRTDLTSGLFTYDNSAMHAETTDQFLPLPQIPGRQPSKAMAPAGSAKAKAAKSPFTAGNKQNTPTNVELVISTSTLLAPTNVELVISTSTLLAPTNVELVISTSTLLAPTNVELVISTSTLLAPTNVELVIFQYDVLNIV